MNPAVKPTDQLLACRRSIVVVVRHYIAGIPRQPLPRSVLVTSSPTREDPREDVARAGRVGRAATRLPDRSDGAFCCGVWCFPSVRVSCRSPNSTSTTRTTCCGQVASILVRHARDMLATSRRGCYEDATRKPLPCNSSLQSRRPLSCRRSSRKIHIIRSICSRRPASTAGRAGVTFLACSINNHHRPSHAQPPQPPPIVTFPPF